jgi:hypothetical protein
MMRKIVAVVIALVAASAAPVTASICAFDPVPAATLLFPFVPFDYNDPLHGTTSMISLTNTSSNSQIVHVTIWSDFGIPILDFNIVLTGYDVQTFNMRDVLYGGQLPVTVQSAERGETPLDSGPVSTLNELNGDWLYGLLEEPQATAALGSRCSPDRQCYPGRYSQIIPGAVLALFQSWLQSSQTADRYYSESCELPYSEPFVPDPEPWFVARTAGSPTWMYVTADVVETCSCTFPTDVGYWVPGSADGEARYDNVLTGEIYWMSSITSTAMPAVHIEADTDLDKVATVGNQPWPISFYGRYANAADDVSDWREPLPTAWALRYFGTQYTPNFDTSIMVWKGSTRFMTPMDLSFEPANESPDELMASNCLAYTYYAWDEDEVVFQVMPRKWGPDPPYVVINEMPLATQQIPVDVLDVPGDRGWLLFVWPASNYAVAGGPAAPDFYQTWMGVAHTAWGTHSDFLTGTVMANYSCWADQVLPQLGVNYDYVDAGGYVISPEAAPRTK